MQTACEMSMDIILINVTERYEACMWVLQQWCETGKEQSHNSNDLSNVLGFFN